MYNINNFQNTGMVYYFSFSDKEENRQTYDKIYYKTNKYHSIAFKILVVQLRRIWYSPLRYRNCHWQFFTFSSLPLAINPTRRETDVISSRNCFLSSNP